jgi:hypothetical protein
MEEVEDYCPFTLEITTKATSEVYITIYYAALFN